MEWRKIEGFERYSVSDTGLVRNDETGGLLKHSTLKKGYLGVKLYKNTKGHSQRIHCLVAKAFISNPENKPQVNHIDGNKQNNTVSNLEWATNSENQIHSYRVLNRVKPKGQDMTAAITAKKKPILCVETGIVYESLMEAERQTGASHANISNCLRGKRIFAGGYRWVYADATKNELEEHFKRCCLRNSPILCVETGVVYPTIKEAARAINGNYKLISKCARGDALTHRGYHWKYAN